MFVQEVFIVSIQGTFDLAQINGDVFKQRNSIDYNVNAYYNWLLAGGLGISEGEM